MLCSYSPETCTCPSTTTCYHILACRLSLGLKVEDKRSAVNLTQLRRNARKRVEKKCGRRCPRPGDAVPAPDSATATSSITKQSDFSFLPTSVERSEPSVPPTSVEHSYPSVPPTSVERSEPSVPPSYPSVPPTSMERSEPSIPPTSVERSEPSIPPTSVEHSYPSVPPTSVERSEPTVPPTLVEHSYPSVPPTSMERSEPSVLPTSVEHSYPSVLPTSVEQCEPSVLPTPMEHNYPSVPPTPALSSLTMITPVKEARAMLAADSEDAPRQKMLPSTKLIRLTTAQRSAIAEGKWLGDNTIHAAQLFLSRQAMGNVSGLTNPLLLHKSLKTSSKPFMHIFNQHENHWVVASNIGCNSGCVRLYDSSSKETDEATNKILSKLLQTSNSFMTVEVMNVQQQRGENDCGATSLVLGQCPTLRSYTQKNMRRHLLDCLES